MPLVDEKAVSLSTAELIGITAGPVQVEVRARVTGGLASLEITGLSDELSRELRQVARATHGSVRSYSCEVIVSGAENSGYSASPVGLAIAVGVKARLDAAEDPSLALDQRLLNEFAFFGEVNLSGDVRSVRGVRAFARFAWERGFRRIVVPRSSAHEASNMPESLEVIGVDTLSEAMERLRKAATEPSSEPCMSDLVLSERVVRAATVAAAGRHSLLITGSPGSGKTALARRIATLLATTLDEVREAAELASVAGIGSGNWGSTPFRAPHHTVSERGLVGGAAGGSSNTSSVRPGEVSLAHGGVLFLDEVPEFRAETLDLLSTVIEKGAVTFDRAQGWVEYPAEAMVVGAMNLCPCGWEGTSKPCQCAPSAKQRYVSRVANRFPFDLWIDLPPFRASEGGGNKAPRSGELRRIVARARLARGLGLSINSRKAVGRVAHTIAFIEGAAHPTRAHQKEAESYSPANFFARHEAQEARPGFEG